MNVRTHASMHACIYVCMNICMNKSGGTHKRMGGRNFVTSMVAAGGVQGGGTLPGAEN